MYHRRRPRGARAPKPRTRIDTLTGPPRVFRLVVDGIEHRPLSDAQFGQLAQQVIDVLQVVQPMRRPGGH